MEMPTNPVNDEIYVSDSGVYRQWNATIKIWKKIPNPDIITPDEAGTHDTTQQIWTGTNAEYQALGARSDDIIYFVKE